MDICLLAPPPRLGSLVVLWFPPLLSALLPLFRCLLDWTASASLELL